jgi:hypothetical protein
MGWLTKEAIQGYRNRALALTPDQRRLLTWDQAGKLGLIPADTLKIAQWSGMERRRDCTPWEAVCHVNHITEEQANETPTGTQDNEVPGPIP